MKHFVRLAALLNDQQKIDMVDLLARMAGDGFAGTPDDSERTFMLIEEVVSQYPLVIEVNREVYMAVDKHSGDRWLFVIELPQATLTDDVLESLPDQEDWRFAAEWAVRNNEWEARIIRIVD